jgi:hypothetical protein
MTFPVVFGSQYAPQASMSLRPLVSAFAAPASLLGLVADVVRQCRLYDFRAGKLDSLPNACQLSGRRAYVIVTTVVSAAIPSVGKCARIVSAT